MRTSGTLASGTRASGETQYADMAIRESAGGGLVFATGSMSWNWGLDGYNAPGWHPDRVSAAAQRITRNVLDRMLEGAGRNGRGRGSERPLGPGVKRPQAFSWSPTGRLRIRWPVAAKIALQSAGATGGTPGSPMPPGRRVARDDVHADLARRHVHARHPVVAEVATARPARRGT